ncbi:MAG: dodecin domain-containing protein [Deltaproteobacteria bacterium]|nr:dodecin domain-containing protein [Deltaproteobacteria bacterium]
MDRVYKKIEIIGISSVSFEDAVNKAVAKASTSLHGLAWFDVVEQHGRIENGKVAEYQAVIKVAFKLDQ